MSRLALITYLDGRDVDPGYGVPAPPAYPGHGLPGVPAHPGNALPPPGSIATLPVFPFDPTIDNSLPGGRPERPDNSLPGAPARPDNSLPGGGHISTMPIVPGRKFIVKWLACYGLILVPDNELPETAEPK
jgi:hypothetical protein